MSDDEIKPSDAAIELSHEELDEVSGGLNLKLNAAFFRQSTVQAGSGGGSPTFSAETIESAGLQVLITDATAEDLEFLGDLLGNATAIEGSD